MAVGDSIVANSQIDCPGCVGFVVKYARRFGEDTDRVTRVRNLGVRGIKTNDLLAQVLHDPTRRAALRASDIVLLSIGTNDGPWRHTDDPCDGKVTLDDSTAGRPGGARRLRRGLREGLRGGLPSPPDDDLLDDPLAPWRSTGRARSP